MRFDRRNKRVVQRDIDDRTIKYPKKRQDGSVARRKLCTIHIMPDIFNLRATRVLAARRLET